jgi:O-antigen ligase
MKNTKKNLFWLWQNVENVLIVIFFLTFTLNIRKVFLTPYSFLNGGFNEYLTMSFSWADLLMVAIMLIYTIKYIFGQLSTRFSPKTSQCNTNSETSISSPLATVSRETFYLLIFLSWAGLSIFWSQYQPIAAYRFLTLVEIALFAFVAVKSLNNAKWLKLTFFAIILNGLFQSLLGIAQFIHNGSLGLRFLGESIIGPNIDGVAKILVGGEKHIRAYGTLPHPNILAGFLLVPLFMLIGEIISRRLLLFYKGEIEGGSDTNHQNLTPTLSLTRRGSSSDVPHETFMGFVPKWTWYAILLITGLGFFLTFSRSAFLGLFVGLLTFLVGISRMQPQGRILKSNFKFLISSVLTLIFIIILLLTNTSFFSNQSLQERTLYQNVSYETILKHPFAGIGIGQFVMNEYQSHPNLESWQYQPAHNTYLLLFSELGIVGPIALALFLATFFFSIERGMKQSARLTSLLFYCIVFSFLLISFFDHYFWDIGSGTLIFALPFALIFALAANSRRCSTKFFRLL